MRWKGRRQSRNVEDRRGRGGRMAVGGGVGLGGIVVILIVILLGGDPQPVLTELSVGTETTMPTGGGTALDPVEQQRTEFISVVLADTEDVWNKLFAEQGRAYEEPTLVLFRDRVTSACGHAGASSGPFYCPGDSNIYIDLSFYDQLASRFGAPGDFAQAYVVAHEVGHHVQNLLGISSQVQAQRNRLSEEEYNALSVRLELQADFLAGVWAHHAQEMKAILESGDVEEALRAAAAIGDDTIQRRSQGHVVPESFTHGTSAQRVHWFRLGLETGDLSRGDTFAEGP